MLSLTLAGSALVQYGKGASCIVEPRMGLVFLDAGRPFTTSSRDHRVISLLVERKAVLSGLGCELPIRDGGPKYPLPRSLANLLAAHLQAIAAEGEQFDHRSAEVAMKAAVDMACVAMARVENLENARYAAGLLAAARRYINANYSNPGLTVDEIAVAVGCSRAHLYRVFATEVASVGDTIRATRLEHSAKLLRSVADMPVKLIAFHCGYADAAAFTRAFRAYHGMTPMEYRNAAQD